MSGNIDWRERTSTVLSDLYDGDFHLLTQGEGNLANCPYYRYYIGEGPAASCNRGCWTEPACVTDQPEHGWRPLREDVMIPHPLWGVRYADGIAR